MNFKEQLIFVATRYYKVLLLCLAALVSLIVAVILLVSEIHSKFPDLPPGVYAGQILGLERGAEEAPIEWYVEVLEAGRTAKVYVLQEGWNAQEISLRGSKDGEMLSEPLVVSGDTAILRFAGRARTEGGFEGEVVRAQDGAEGGWTLMPIEIMPVYSDQALSQLRLLLSFISERNLVETKIEELQKQVPIQKQEIENLTRFITQEGVLKDRAEKKLTVAKEAFVTLQSDLDIKKKEAKELEDKIILAQRVTGMGKLASLSRESLERESRWIESMLASGMGESPDLIAAIEKAERIASLKREIAAEREKVVP